MRIVTDSRKPEEPKDPEKDNVFAIYKHFALNEDSARVKQRYLQGGLAYSEIKNELYELLDSKFSDARDKYGMYMEDWEYLENILLQGAEKARKKSVPKIGKLRKAIGID
jgi:tryptophanyl-tRNA synthetase